MDMLSAVLSPSETAMSVFNRREKKKSKAQTIQCTVYRVTPVWYPYITRHQYMNLNPKKKHSKKGCGSSWSTMQTKKR